MTARPTGAKVIPIRPGADTAAAAARALAVTDRFLDRCKLAPNTVRAYRRQCAAYVAWLGEDPTAHPDAFVDVVGAEAALTGWRRHQLEARKKPASVNQAIAAATLMYEQGAQLKVDVKRVRIPRPGEPDALTDQQRGAVEREATRRGVRDAAIIAVLLHTGARVAECARLDVVDVTITARTGEVRLHGKGDEVRNVPLPPAARGRVSAWLLERGAEPGPLWSGQRGQLSASGITQVVLAVGAAVHIPGLRPHRLRHTYATGLRRAGMDPAQIQGLMGHVLLETTSRYFRAGKAELAAIVDRIFEQ